MPPPGRASRPRRPTAGPAARAGPPDSGHFPCSSLRVAAPRLASRRAPPGTSAVPLPVPLRAASPGGRLSAGPPPPCPRGGAGRPQSTRGARPRPPARSPRRGGPGKKPVPSWQADRCRVGRTIPATCSGGTLPLIVGAPYRGRQMPKRDRLKRALWAARNRRSGRQKRGRGWAGGALDGGPGPGARCPAGLPRTLGTARAGALGPSRLQRRGMWDRVGNSAPSGFPSKSPCGPRVGTRPFAGSAARPKQS